MVTTPATMIPSKALPISVLLADNLPVMKVVTSTVCADELTQALQDQSVTSGLMKNRKHPAIVSDGRGLLSVRSWTQQTLSSLAEMTAQDPFRKSCTRCAQLPLFFWRETLIG